MKNNIGDRVFAEVNENEAINVGPPPTRLVFP